MNNKQCFYKFSNKQASLIVNYPFSIITMEPEVGAFLARIAKSISLILLWMLINTYFGVRKELFFLDGKITSWHVVFYSWFVLSGIFLLWFIIRLWKYAPVYDPKENMWYQKLRKGEKADEE